MNIHIIHSSSELTAGSISDHDKAHIYIINNRHTQIFTHTVFQLVSVCVSTYNILWTYFHFRTLRTNKYFKLLLSIVDVQ